MTTLSPADLVATSCLPLLRVAARSRTTRGNQQSNRKALLGNECELWPNIRNSSAWRSIITQHGLRARISACKTTPHAQAKLYTHGRQDEKAFNAREEGKPTAARALGCCLDRCRRLASLAWRLRACRRGLCTGAEADPQARRESKYTVRMREGHGEATGIWEEWRCGWGPCRMRLGPTAQDPLGGSEKTTLCSCWIPPCCSCTHGDLPREELRGIFERVLGFLCTDDPGRPPFFCVSAGPPRSRFETAPGSWPFSLKRSSCIFRPAPSHTMKIFRTLLGAPVDSGYVMHTPSRRRQPTFF